MGKIFVNNVFKDIIWLRILFYELVIAVKTDNIIISSNKLVYR